MGELITVQIQTLQAVIRNLFDLFDEVFSYLIAQVALSEWSDKYLKIKWWREGLTQLKNIYRRDGC